MWNKLIRLAGSGNFYERWNYTQQPRDPRINDNPKALDAIFLNLNTLTTWRCIDKTKNQNKWIDPAGNIIQPNPSWVNLDYLWTDMTIVQGTWAFYSATTQTEYSLNWVPSVGFNYNTSNAIGDGIVTKPINFPIGNYQINICGVKYVNRGIITVYAGTENIGTFDWYATTGIYNTHVLINFSITTNEVKAIKIIVTGKNASSTGYNFTPSWLKITKI